MTARPPSRWALLSLPLALALSLGACQRPTPAASRQPTAEPAYDLQAQAAAEATAIIARAQSTALVLQAQAEATALVRQAGESPPVAQVTRSLPALTSTPDEPAQQVSTPTTAASSVGATARLTDSVELLRVGFGADGAFVHVSYRAPPSVAQTFWPGVLSVTDEGSGTVFNEVPVMATIGPLIARPVEEGQIGYVMLVHNPPILHPGALVTVVLGDYRFEHVPVQ